MKREIIETADGSSTIYLPELNEHYHSKHGAIQEAQHVFIKMGLLEVISLRNPSEISILEIGFGTGLNALVTWRQILNKSISVKYTGVEAYPILEEEVANLNFPEELSEIDGRSFFKKLHSGSWEETHKLSENFTLTKQNKFFHEIDDKLQYDLIYFDAFGARVQPELWTVEIFQKMYDSLIPGGILVTYAAKGSVRRAMLEVGFLVEKLPGPPGKREMLRATKK
ncbi:MAG: tRNA (5-methylaminomethyl-2-thiouridine)(34)-methyltransferase MnmD [Gillisia sp.]